MGRQILRPGAGEEYLAARHRVGLSDISAAGRLRFSGPDRKKFLNGLLTNDIQSLRSWRGLPACLLNPKGKLQADFLLYDIGEQLLAVGHPRAIDGLSAALSKVIVLSQTSIEDAAEDLLFYLLGPHSSGVLERAFGEPYALEPYQCRAASAGGTAPIVLAEPRLSPQGHILSVPKRDARELWGRLLDAGKSLGISPIGVETLNILRIERGIPLFGVDMDAAAIPFEARLEDAISYTKGCYVGQETISRIHHMGHVNRILVQLRLDGAGLPAPQAKAFKGDREIGRVTSAVNSPALGAVIALATIRVEASKPGTRIQVKDGAGTRDAEVLEFGKLLSQSEEAK